MRLRTSLFALVLATAVPLALFGLVVAIFTVEHEHDNFVKLVKDRNRAFMAAVDAELRGHVATLQALAAIRSLADDDLRAFHRDAIAALGTQRDWENLTLSSVNGAQLVNARVPFGVPLPMDGDVSSLRDALGRREPRVGSLRKRVLTQTLAIPVRVPVLVNGDARYVLTAALRPELFERLLRAQNLPTTWASGLVDAEGNFIARVPPRAVGTASSADFRKAIAQSGEGWYHGLTVEGADTYTAFVKSEMTGWAIGLAVPSSEYWQGARRGALLLGAGALACLAASLLLALGLTRRVSQPIGALAARVANLESPASVPVDTDIDEIRDLVKALDVASQALADRRDLAARERRLLEDADRAKDEFLAMLSHEMRNPLAALTTAAQLLKLSPPGSEGARSAQTVVERQTAQVTRLVEDLLDVSRITLGKARLDLETIDLAELAHRLAETWRYSGRLAGRALELRAAQPVWVSGDRSRLDQVLANLLDNAVKFSPADSTITLAVDVDGDRARAIVRDRGIGIPPDQLQSVFGLFVQAPQGLSRTRGGLGVGLAVAKKIVELHRGVIEAASDGAGSGSTFTVLLPLAAAPAAAASLRDARGTTHAPLRVLVIEDNADVARTMEDLLALLGHDARRASTGGDGVRVALEWRPDVALVDIGLPDIDGYEVARAIREAGVGSALVAVTGYGQSADRERALAAGFDQHVTKPLSLDTIESLIARIAPA